MRDFSKVSPKLWRSPRFRSLDSDDAKLLYVFLLSCEHQTSAGCFRLPDAYAASDLAWDAERLHTARVQLIEVGLVVHDSGTDEYFVPRWFWHNPITNPKHMKGAERLISELDSDHVREAAEVELSEHQPSKNPLDPPMEPLPNNSRLLNSGYFNGTRR